MYGAGHSLGRGHSGGDNQEGGTHAHARVAIQKEQQNR